MALVLPGRTPFFRLTGYVTVTPALPTLPYFTHAQTLRTGNMFVCRGFNAPISLNIPLIIRGQDAFLGVGWNHNQIAEGFTTKLNLSCNSDACVNLILPIQCVGSSCNGILCVVNGEPQRRRITAI
jgi:hypothetical protein